MDKTTAEALFSELREGLVNTERVLTEIIRSKAWEALGYPTFVAAWTDRMRGVRLATDVIRAHVVYAALDDGMAPEEIAFIFPVSDSFVEGAREARDAGINPSNLPAGYSWVRRHPRRAQRDQAKVLRVRFTADEFSHLKLTCHQHGLDLEGIAKKAIWDAVGDVLASSQKGRTRKAG